MLASGKDQILKCLGALNELFIVGKLVTKFEKNIANIDCPNLYWDFGKTMCKTCLLSKYPSIRP
jgi:hypothetical protein